MKTIKKYIDFFYWMICDSLLRYRNKVLLVSFADFVGVSMQVAALWVLLQYIFHLESGKPINILDYSIVARDSFQVFFVFTTVAFFLLLLSAWLIFYSDVQKIKLRVLFERFCSQRAFLAYEKKSFFLFLATEKLKNTGISKIAIGDARYYSRALFMVFNLLKPVCYLVIAVPAMLYISTRLTFILGAVVLISLFFQYLVSKNAAKQSVLLENYNMRSNLEKKQLISFLDACSLSNEADSKDRVKDKIKLFFSSRTIVNRYKTLEERLKGAPQSSFISNVLMAFGIFIILIVLIRQSLFIEPQWASTIAFLISLKISLSQLGAINRILTGINRFYPQISRYRRFICFNFNDSDTGIDD
ncbi:hypothetical protein OOT00_15800 [Desulfobotulus sp. H1]|uniref:ABC transmembrane type-1 domain-containing protein n=1 Tax=Desulfobotulus pelophilus TaxID=2823377 RepID=A0ABT3NDA0_9BACT|nr:hypothetical protein [Desulfobotulus pelophilus]MCW7755440.1 hypothetical protein [Desulfobotulus pelophilus]